MEDSPKQKLRHEIRNATVVLSQLIKGLNTTTYTLAKLELKRIEAALTNYVSLEGHDKMPNK